MKNIKKITHAIFDMDGLMFDNEQLYAMSFEKAIGPAYNLKLTQQDYLPFMGLNGADTARLLFEKYGIPYTEWEQVCSIDTEWIESYVDENGIIIKPGLIKLLQWLKNSHISYTIASGSPRDRILKYLRISSLEPYFDLSKIVDGSMVAFGKPSPDIFLTAADKMGCAHPQSCVVFEDSFNGVAAAARGEFPCILVPNREDPSDFSNLDYLAKLNSLDEAIEVLTPLV